MSGFDETNPFETENARSMEPVDLAGTFVPTQAYWRLFARKHNILLGSRGSGKTAVARMLSHECMKRLEDEKAKAIIDDKSFIGMYMATRLDWVGSLRNKPWGTLAEKELYFQWYLNISTCQSFLASVKSCLSHYVADRRAAVLTESSIVLALSEAWLNLHPLDNEQTIEWLQEKLTLMHYRRQQANNYRYMRTLLGEKPGLLTEGSEFDVDLFSPLMIGITIASKYLCFSTDTAWILAIDEAEFLDDDYLRILNSQMRSASNNLFIKLTTLPYAHSTTETNSQARLNPGDDFDYIYIDHDPVTYSDGGVQDKLVDPNQQYSFAKQLFRKRAQWSGGRYKQLSLSNLFGESLLLDASSDDWAPKSDLRTALQRESDRKLAERAKALLEAVDSGDPDAKRRFDDQIGRKVGGRLALRVKLKSITGNAGRDAYCGLAMIERCSDGNPRRLVKIINAMLKQYPQWRKRSKIPRIPYPNQDRILTEFSRLQLDKVLPEDNGPELHQLLTNAGSFFGKQARSEPLKIDDYSSLEFDEQSFLHYKKVIELGCALGLLFPFEKVTSSLPRQKGKFRLAFVLAPQFGIFPRKGKAISLSRIPQTPNQARLDFENA